MTRFGKGVVGFLFVVFVAASIYFGWLGDVARAQTVATVTLVGITALYVMYTHRMAHEMQLRRHAQAQADRSGAVRADESIKDRVRAILTAVPNDADLRPGEAPSLDDLEGPLLVATIQKESDPGIRKELHAMKDAFAALCDAARAGDYEAFPRQCKAVRKFGLRAIELVEARAARRKGQDA